MEKLEKIKNYLIKNKDKVVDKTAIVIMTVVVAVVVFGLLTVLTNIILRHFGLPLLSWFEICIIIAVIKLFRWLIE